MPHEPFGRASQRSREPNFCLSGIVALEGLGVAHARVLVDDEVHDLADARPVELQHGLGDPRVHACIESGR